MTRTPSGDRWRQMQDLARGQALRLGDPEWRAPDDPYADRVESFRAGSRTDDNVVGVLAQQAGRDGSVLEVGAGAGRLSLPLAARVRDVIALEPSPAMTATLESDAAAAPNVRVMRGGWQDLADSVADGVFAAHVVYSLPAIEDFILRLQRAARKWCAVIAFADPPQARLFDFWPRVFDERRHPNPSLVEVLDVARSLGIYPQVTMLDVPMWPLGPAERARNGLRRRLHITPGSALDERLASAMSELLMDWGDGVLGPRDRRPLPLGVMHWMR